MPVLGEHVGTNKTDRVVDHMLAWKEGRPIDWEYYKIRFEHTASIYLKRAAEILYDKENRRSDDSVKQTTLNSWVSADLLFVMKEGLIIQKGDGSHGSDGSHEKKQDF